MSVSISFLACKCIHVRKCHPILFYHPKKLFYQLYYTILQHTQHPKNLLFYHFIKILFLIFLYYFFPIVIFFFKFSHDSNGHIFLGILLKYYFLIFPTLIFFPTVILIPTVTFSLAFIISFQQSFIFKFNNYSKQPAKFFFLLFAKELAKYQCKIHMHIYRCILPNINAFNLPTLMIHTHTHTHIEPTNFFFFFFYRKNLPNINLLKLANFKNPHTYIYMQSAKYQCTQLANLKNPHTYNIHATYQISMYSTCQL